MRRFFEQHRSRLWLKSFSFSFVICLFLYIIIRCFSFDFPMSWKEELVFFFKIVFTGCFLIVASFTGSAMVYQAYVKIRRNKKAI